MADVVILPPGDVAGSGEYRLQCSVAGQLLTFEAHHNRVEDRWYLSCYEADGTTAIFRGAKVVLGTFIGRRSAHPLMRTGAFVAVDLTRTAQEATYTTLSRTVAVRWYSQEEIATWLGFADGQL